MKRQSGFGLSEVLISLFLASIIMTLLVQIYLANKQQSIQAQKLLAMRFDLQWVSELLSDSIRRAGFTPCLGIEQLKFIDNRDRTRIPFAIKVQNHPRQLIEINRMSEVVAKVVSIQSPTQIVLSSTLSINKKRPVLIADCEHAEVHEISEVVKNFEGYSVNLVKPLIFSYETSAYVGQWLEEKWFIKKNVMGIDSLFYQLFQTEELTPLIHSLQTNVRKIQDKRVLDIVLGLDGDKTHQLTVAVRGS